MGNERLFSLREKRLCAIAATSDRFVSCCRGSLVRTGRSRCGAAGAAQQRTVIVGSGSNIPVYLYQAWRSKFNAGNVQVRCLPLGISESIRQVKAGIGDFGGGEILLTDEQMRDSKTALTIPTVFFGIVPIYNLPGNPELSFSGGLLAEIFLGTVKNWKDPQIARLNPSVELPDLPISVVHRKPARWYVSRAIFEEYREVLARPELDIREGPRCQLLRIIKNRSHFVAPTRRLEVTKDPDDNVFLECADAAGADYSITGNPKHFPKFWKKTKVITPREFISLVAPHRI